MFNDLSKVIGLITTLVHLLKLAPRNLVEPHLDTIWKLHMDIHVAHSKNQLIQKLLVKLAYRVALVSLGKRVAMSFYGMLFLC